jgi:hypothetical protein
MPAGFFFSAAGRDMTKPNRFIALLYAGATSLAVGGRLAGDRTACRIGDHRAAAPETFVASLVHLV